MNPFSKVVPQYKQEENRHISLPYGSQLVISTGGDTLELLNDKGAVQLTLRITPAGPVLDVRASHLRIQADESLSLQSNQISIEAEESLTLSSRGDMNQQVAGDLHTAVDAHHKEAAQRRSIQAKKGDLHLKANDFVRLDGEMIKLNCDE